MHWLIFVMLSQQIFQTHCLRSLSRLSTGLRTPHSGGGWRIQRLSSTTKSAIDDYAPLELSYEEAERDVREQIQQGEPRLITFEAFVSRRRPLGSSLTFLDLASGEDPEAPRLQALLKRQTFLVEDHIGNGDDSNIISSSTSGSCSDQAKASFSAWSKVLQPGCKVKLTGTAGPTTTPGEGLLEVRSINLLGPPAAAHHVAMLLRAYRDNQAVPRQQLAFALGLSSCGLSSSSSANTMGTTAIERGVKACTSSSNGAVDSSPLSSSLWAGGTGGEFEAFFDDLEQRIGFASLRDSNIPPPPLPVKRAAPATTNKHGRLRFPRPEDRETLLDLALEWQKWQKAAATAKIAAVEAPETATSSLSLSSLPPLVCSSIEHAQSLPSCIRIIPQHIVTTASPSSSSSSSLLPPPPQGVVNPPSFLLEAPPILFEADGLPRSLAMTKLEEEREKEKTDDRSRDGVRSSSSSINSQAIVMSVAEVLANVSSRTASASFTATDNHTEKHSTVVEVEGWVQGRQRFDGGIALLDLTDKYSPMISTEEQGTDNNNHNWGSNSARRLRCVLHPKLRHTSAPPSLTLQSDPPPSPPPPSPPRLSSSSSSLSNNRGRHDNEKNEKKRGGWLQAYAESCAPGTFVRVKGVVVVAANTATANTDTNDNTEEGSGHLWVHSVELLRACWHPKALEAMIEATRNGLIPMQEAGRALQLLKDDSNTNASKQINREKGEGEEEGNAAAAVAAVAETKAAAAAVEEEAVIRDVMKLSPTERAWFIRQRSGALLEGMPTTTSGGGSGGGSGAASSSGSHRSMGHHSNHLNRPQAKLLEDFTQGPMSRKWPVVAVGAAAATPLSSSASAAAAAASSSSSSSSSAAAAASASAPKKTTKTASWFERNKRPQIEWMLDQIAPLLDAHEWRQQREVEEEEEEEAGEEEVGATNALGRRSSRDNDERELHGGNNDGGVGDGDGGVEQQQQQQQQQRVQKLSSLRRPLVVVDVGGGKGKLASAIVQRFGPQRVHVTVVELRSGAAGAGQASALKRGIGLAGMMGGGSIVAGAGAGSGDGGGANGGGANNGYGGSGGLRFTVADASSAKVLDDVARDAQADYLLAKRSSSSKSRMSSSSSSSTSSSSSSSSKGSSSTSSGGVDLVVALHACGALSDVAVAQAVRLQAAFLVCPCCFCSNKHLKLPAVQQQQQRTATTTSTQTKASSSRRSVDDGDITGAGLFVCRPLGSAFSSSIGGCTSLPTTITTTDPEWKDTESEGEGSFSQQQQQQQQQQHQQVSPADWLGVDVDDLLLLCRAAELQGDPSSSKLASHALCALRAEAAVRHWRKQTWGGINVTIKQFPAEYSSRNLCLTGVPVGWGFEEAGDAGE